MNVRQLMRTVRVFAVAGLVLMASTMCSAAGEQPFGLRRGMSAEQVIVLVGRKAITDSGVVRGFPVVIGEDKIGTSEGAKVPSEPEDFGSTRIFSFGPGYPLAWYPYAPEDASSVSYLVLNTAPNPYAAFESYVLKFFGRTGLLHVTAMSPLIKTGAAGDELKAKYELMATVVEARPAVVGFGVTPSDLWLRRSETRPVRRSESEPPVGRLFYADRSH
jgi:hypothetical protein